MGEAEKSISPVTIGETMKVQLIKKPEVLVMCAISNATLYRMIKKGAFCEPVSLTGGRAVAWRKSEVIAWIENRPKVCLSTQNKGGV